MNFGAEIIVGYEKAGWWLTYPSEKYEFVSWDSCSQYMEKTCLKPPTSIGYNGNIGYSVATTNGKWFLVLS